MNGYLLDTSVLSAIAPGRPPLPAHAAEWIRRESDRLFVPSIAVAEISDGIAKLRRSGATTRADMLSTWIETLTDIYGDRVLPFDKRAAWRAGELSDATRASGRHPGFPDLAIAATADVEGLTVATHNLRHFEAIGVSCFDPLA